MNAIPVTWRPLHAATPWLRGLAATLEAQIGAWRRAAHRRRLADAIEGLGDATLRDIGLDRPERPGRHGIAHRDFLRGL